MKQIFKEILEIGLPFSEDDMVTVNLKQYVKVKDLTRIDEACTKWVKEIHENSPKYEWIKEHAIFFGDHYELMVDHTVVFAIWLLVKSEDFTYLFRRQCEPGLNEVQRAVLHQELSKIFTIAEDLLLKYASVNF